MAVAPEEQGEPSAQGGPFPAGAQAHPVLGLAPRYGQREGCARVCVRAGLAEGREVSWYSWPLGQETWAGPLLFQSRGR